MSITSALHNAVSGLGAASRSAQVVSSNIANALTDGYGRRDAALTSVRTGGVAVARVVRHADTGLITDRRGAGADAQGEAARAGALQRMSAHFGEADSADSLSGRMARLEATLTEAASRPESKVRLDAVASAAGDLAARINRAADGVQAERLAADGGIARDVEALQQGLARVDKLNELIVAASAGGRDASGLMDQRQQVIDDITQIVPMREVPRKAGAIALMTEAGQMLLDSRPAEIGFAPVTAISAAHSLGDGFVGGLTVNGRAVDMADPNGRMSGGTLAARFDIRDRIAPQAQEALDTLARDLVERFQDPAVDPSLAVGDPGLFTDRGAALDTANLAGLSGRLTLNAAVDPAAGGASWKLRDGINAAAEGAQGNSRLLLALGDSLTTSRTPSSIALGSGARNAGGMADSVLSHIGGALFAVEQRETFAASRAEALYQQELAGGVDTDQEMQSLLLIERAYGANARVIEVADAMMKRLLEI